jgi:hypothetical protein
VTDLVDSYKRLAHPWSGEQLAARYRAADRRGRERLGDDVATTPIASLAAAIPSTTTLAVAIHVLHAVPHGAGDGLAPQLLQTAVRNASAALHHCHRALELDGASHGYTPDEWLAVVCERAALLLQSAELDSEPPTIVGQTREAVSWLSHALVELEQDSPEAAAALAETLARLLTVWVFADDANTLDAHHDE